MPSGAVCYSVQLEIHSDWISWNCGLCYATTCICWIKCRLLMTVNQFCIYLLQDSSTGCGLVIVLEEVISVCACEINLSINTTPNDFIIACCDLIKMPNNFIIVYGTLINNMSWPHHNTVITMQYDIIICNAYVLVMLTNWGKCLGFLTHSLNSTTQHTSVRGISESSIWIWTLSSFSV